MFYYHDYLKHQKLNEDNHYSYFGLEKPFQFKVSQLTVNFGFNTNLSTICCFKPGILSWRKFGQKTCLFKLILGTKTYLNNQNPMVIHNYSSFYRKNLLREYQSYKFTVKSSTYTNSNIQNSIVKLTFSFKYEKHPFSVIFFQKMYIVNSN